MENTSRIIGADALTDFAANLFVAAGLPPADYGVNRAIDRTLRAFTWDQLGSLIERAGLLRKAVVLRHCRDLVKAARADWPAPMLVATIAVSAVPKPKAIGTRMYSSRAATP